MTVAHQFRDGAGHQRADDAIADAVQRVPNTALGKLLAPFVGRPADRQLERAVDGLDKCGVYYGTTGGQVYGSKDGGDSWDAIVRDLPPVLSVEVQTLAS